MAADTLTVLHVTGEHWRLIGRRRGASDNQNQRTEVGVEVEAEARGQRSRLTDYKIDKSQNEAPSLA